MTQKRSDRKITIRNSIIIVLSGIGLMVCLAILFPQVRRMILDFAEQILHREILAYQKWFEILPFYAMGGICFILFFDYCTLIDSGRELVQKVKEEIKDCLSGIDFRSFVRPGLVMFGVYLLGILTIIRTDFLYKDDLVRSVRGYRGWHDWSRYVTDFFSILVHGDTNLTDISPLPQLLAILILACSSVLLVYVMNNKKITMIPLLASIPLGLSPFFLECLSYKFDAPYMALSGLASIVPFLFIARKKAFLFCSIIGLLIMCMTYQAASGIYPMIAVMLSFQIWNSGKKPIKEILSFLGTAAVAFCSAILIFKFFLMKPLNEQDSSYVSNAIHLWPHLISGILSNIKTYAIIVSHDLGPVWKECIAFICIFFIIKSLNTSGQKKALSFFVSILVISLSFILSYGVYSLLEIPLFALRALLGFGVFLAILCIYIVSNYKKTAIIPVLALNWSFLVFAFSYGNALADEARYADFQISMLLHDLSALYPDLDKEGLSIQLKNSIDYAPSIKNISKHYPVIERLIPRRLGDSWLLFGATYFLGHFNYSDMVSYVFASDTDFCTLNLPVVLESYYHTIQSDGKNILVILKH